MPEMSEGFLMETQRLLMSWASDAQHHFMIGWQVKTLNEFKKIIIGIMKLEHTPYEDWKAFREKYTSNY